MAKYSVKEFFDKDTSTFTYIVYDPITSDAVVIDPVWNYNSESTELSCESIKEVSSFITSKNLTVRMLMETHVHADHISAAKYLQGLTYVDGDNIGIWGWSGGGYLTNMCMTLASDYYKAGISIAPNVEPLLYDTIWTERYMGLVDENPEGYKNASVLTHVDKAKGFLLQIHGNADDNVHHQHSIKLAKAYAEHGKDMEMFIYSNANHGMSNNNFLTEDYPADGWKNRYHLYKKMADFFMEHLASDTF